MKIKSKKIILVLVLVLFFQFKTNFICFAPVVASSSQLFNEEEWAVDSIYPAPSLGLCATELNGKIYVSGGINSNELYEYDPQTGIWTSKANMQYKRSGHALVAVNNKLYAIGGWYSYGYGDGNMFTNTIEEYDISLDSWTTKTNMPTRRDGVAAAVEGNIIYVVGGYNGTMLNTVEAYDTLTDTWSTKASMIKARRVPGAATIDGKIYVVGGKNNTIEVFDPVNDRWTLKSSMTTLRGQAGVIAVNSQIYVIGGETSITDVMTSTVEIYSPYTDTWSFGSSLPTGLRYFGITNLDNQIYVISGKKTGCYSSDVMRYSVRSDNSVNQLLYVYDINGRLKEIKNNGNTVVIYNYDRNGNLVSKNTY